MRFNEAEIKQMQDLFGNDETLKLIRKVFLPTIDGTEEIGMLTDRLLAIDPNVTLDTQALAERVSIELGILRHIEGSLSQIKQLAAQPVSEEEKAEAAAKDSSK